MRRGSSSENWELSAATTYLDAAIDDDILINNGAIVAGQAGDPLPVVPEWKTFASIQYNRDLPWNGLSAMARFDYNFVDEFGQRHECIRVSPFGASASVPTVAVPTRSDRSTSCSNPSEGWTAWLGVDNLWDERAPLSLPRDSATIAHIPCGRGK